MDFSQGVLFDPGYSKYTLPFSSNIDAAYNMLFSIKAPHQRKFKFQLLYPQLLKLLEQNVAFYLGCLLWASFISYNFKDSPKSILENSYLDKTVNEKEMFFEINYAISYLEKLKKDCKYYLGKNCNIPENWQKILSAYKKFLEINSFLVHAKTTADIKLPEELKYPQQDDLNCIIKTIESAINTGNLPVLFNAEKYIF